MDPFEAIGKATFYTLLFYLILIFVVLGGISYAIYHFTGNSVLGLIPIMLVCLIVLLVSVFNGLKYRKN